MYFSLLKLVIKPDSLLLETRRSQTSSEGHNQTSALPLFFELALTIVDKHFEKVKDYRFGNLLSFHRVCLQLQELTRLMITDKDLRRKVCVKLSITCFQSSNVAVVKIFYHCCE